MVYRINTTLLLALSKMEKGSRNNTEKTIYGTTKLMELWSRMPFLSLPRRLAGKKVFL